MSDMAGRMAMWSAWHRRQARECDRETLVIGGCAFNQSADAWSLQAEGILQPTNKGPRAD